MKDRTQSRRALGISLLFLLSSSCSIPSVQLPEMPKELERPGVLPGNRSFRKTFVYDASNLGRVSDLRYGEFDNQPGGALAVVGRSGAVFLDEARTPKRTVRFARSHTSQVFLVDLEGDGVWEFLDRGSWGGKVILFGPDGSVRWTYGSFLGVHDAAAGDVDGDGLAEIVVGGGVWQEVHLLRANGRPVWSRTDFNVWHVEVADLDGDGRGEILHSNAAGELVVRDRAGNVIATHKPDPHLYISDFTLTRWGEGSAANYVVAARDGAVEILDPAGEIAATLKAPGLAEIGGVTHATPVRFPDGTIYQATLVSYLSWQRSVLYLHNRRGEVTYEEVFGESCGGLTTMPRDGAESLLVGCEAKVWEYTPASRRRRK